MELMSNNHSVFMLHYHLILVVKYRRKVITDEISRKLGIEFEKVCEDLVKMFSRKVVLLSCWKVKIKVEERRNDIKSQNL